MNDTAILVPKEEYDFLKKKADLFDHFVETENLSKVDLKKIETALKSRLITKSEFLRRHSNLK